MAEAAPLFEAIRAGDRAGVMALLAEDPSLAGATEDGVSAILLAAYHGQEELARLLAQQGGHLDLFEAAALGDAARVGALLAEDPGLADQTTPDGHGALGLAAYFGHEQVVALLARWCDPNMPSRNAMRVTPLHAALASRRPHLVPGLTRTLLAHGADPNRRQEGGWTPLHAAAAAGQVEALRLLLAHGADPAAINDAEQSPRDLASLRGHDAIVALLDAEVG